MPSMVRRIESAGARGVTLFNRFYQPDVDLETLGVDRRLHVFVACGADDFEQGLALDLIGSKTQPLAVGGIGESIDQVAAPIANAARNAVQDDLQVALAPGQRSRVRVAVRGGQLEQALLLRGLAACRAATRFPTRRAGDRLHADPALQGLRGR